MALKPKSVRRFTVRPGSSEQVFTQMVAGCEALWRETHLESMVKRTIKLLQSNFKIQDFALVKLVEDKTRLKAESVPLQSNGDEPMSAAQLECFLGHLKRSDLKKNDFPSGISRLEIDRKAFNFALLGDQPNDWFALIWPETEPFLVTGSEPMQNPSLHYSADLALDFLIKQLQTSCHWFTKFSESQTLLHLDDLTGLYNHRYLEQAIEREIKRSIRYDSSFCLLFIDLDDFKPVNDSYGHLAGSQVLREVAQILKATLRDVDLVFRFGGDEFVVILIESDAAGGFKTAQRIRERIQYTGFHVAPGVAAHVTASIGVAAFPEHAKEKQRLLALADECMYQSKRNGKNQVVLVGQKLVDAPPQLKEEKNRWETN